MTNQSPLFMSFFDKLPQISFSKNEIIVKPGKIDDDVYYLEKGYVRLYTYSPQGQELTIAIFKGPTYFPLSWSPSDNQVRYYYQAMNPIKMRKVSLEQMTETVTRYPELGVALLLKARDRIGLLMQRFESMMMGTAKERIISFLLTSIEHFSKLDDGVYILELPFSHKDIAAFTGLTRETVSTEMVKLKRNGCVQYVNRYITVSSIEKLKNCAAK
jgi:CRP-like cAMP-binding protein